MGKATLCDICEAVGAPPFVVIGNRSEKTSCLVEQAVNAALGSAFDEAEALLVRQLGHVTLAGNVAIAVADGAMAGLGAHRSLVLG